MLLDDLAIPSSILYSSKTWVAMLSGLHEVCSRSLPQQIFVDGQAVEEHVDQECLTNMAFEWLTHKFVPR